MTIIVDANILISGIINPYGPIYEMLLLKNKEIDFVTPEFAIEEIVLHTAKVCRGAKISEDQFKYILASLLSRILQFSPDSISQVHITKAQSLVETIDPKDAWYVAFTMALNALLWTGDMKLYKGLRRKKFLSIITTSEAREIINGV